MNTPLITPTVVRAWQSAAMVRTFDADRLDDVEGVLWIRRSSRARRPPPPPVEGRDAGTITRGLAAPTAIALSLGISALGGVFSAHQLVALVVTTALMLGAVQLFDS